MAVRTERSEVRTKTTEGQYSPVRLEQARLVSSLLYGTRVMLVLKLLAFENKKYTSYDHFHGNGPYGKIPTKKEPIRTPGFTPRLPCHIINDDTARNQSENNNSSPVMITSRTSFKRERICDHSAIQCKINIFPTLRQAPWYFLFGESIYKTVRARCT